MKDKNSVLRKLKEAKFKLTPQRMAIIEILIRDTSHPSADAIYEKLKKKFPMMSYSTIYNTLNILKDLGEIIELLIRENKINYDPNTTPHHHFLCEICGKIKDIYQKPDIDIHYIDNHKIKKCRIYFYGICSNCLKNRKDD